MVSDEHIKILKMLLKQKEYPVSNPEPLGNQLQYLATLKYVHLINNCSKCGEPSNPRYIISEEGKAYLCELNKHSKEKWIPYIITTIISVFALMKSYGYGIDDVIIWCMKRLGL